MPCDSAMGRRKERRLIPCSCGCEELILNFDSDGKPMKFKFGHVWNGRKHTQETKQKLHIANLGRKQSAEMIAKISNENNSKWKGDQVKYRSLHKYVKKYFPPPELCEICNKKPVLDLANKTGVYNREFINWFYLCRSCHIRQDGRIYTNLKQYQLRSTT